MTPTQLRAFHLVAESGSFSAAARASGLSQPNLSGQVTALEKAYGVRLFDRGGRSVVPTETGRQLHGLTTRLFALQDEARALLAGEQALTRGHLRIAADSAHHVVPIMAALRKRAEGLTFALSIDNSAVVLERLLRHEADVAVMAKSVSDPRLHAVRLRIALQRHQHRGDAHVLRGDVEPHGPLHRYDTVREQPAAGTAAQVHRVHGDRAVVQTHAARMRQSPYDRVEARGERVEPDVLDAGCRSRVTAECRV